MSREARNGESPTWDELDAIVEGKSAMDLAERIWRLEKLLDESIFTGVKLAAELQIARSSRPPLGSKSVNAQNTRQSAVPECATQTKAVSEVPAMATSGGDAGVDGSAGSSALSISATSDAFQPSGAALSASAPTPRTDALSKQLDPHSGLWVEAEEYEQLERELADAKRGIATYEMMAKDAARSSTAPSVKALLEALEWYADRDAWTTADDLKTSEIRAGDAWTVAAGALAQWSASTTICGKLNDGLPCQLPKGTACPDCDPAAR